MASKSKASEAEHLIEIPEVSTGLVEFCLLGTSPYQSNIMSEKAKQELLNPGGKKTATEKAANLKHNPLREFRQSVAMDWAADNYAITIPAAAFKRAIANAALDAPGATKAQIGRLVWVLGDRVPLFGVPELSMMIVRMNDMTKTPDVRTRAMFKQWATVIRVQYIIGAIRPQGLANLLTLAGLTQGVGDGRPEKGKLSYGQFRIVPADDPEFLAIVRSAGREPQLRSLQTPTFYDDEARKLYEWFCASAHKRGFALDDSAFEATLAEVLKEN